MKKFARLLAIMTMIVIITLVGVNSVSFGYFFMNDISINDGGKAEFADKTIDPNIRKVANLTELYLASRDVQYNSNAQVSAARHRYTILLTADILLSANLIITADCNVDLGGHTLSLGANTLTFAHSYYGALQVYNGNVIGDNGAAVTVNTPNAAVDLTGAVIAAEVNVQIVNVNADEIFNLAIDMIRAKLHGGKASREVNRECSRHVTAVHECAYVSYDIDLPTHVYGYDVGFIYASDKTSAMTAMGKVSGAVGNVVDVNLSVTLSLGESQQTHTFAVHVYSPQDTQALESAALIAAADTLERYHVDTAEGGQYNLYQSTYLPRYSLGLQLDYITLTAGGLQRDNTQNIVGNNFEAIDINGYAVSLDEYVVSLQIVAPSGAMLTLAVNGSDVSSVVDNYTIALKIAEELYGEEILIKAENGHNGYTKQFIHDDMTKYADKGVVGVEYFMSYDIDKTYRIGALPQQDGRYIYVGNATNPPTILQKSGLRIRFSFNSDPTMVSLIVPIRFVQDDETEGNMLTKFWPYYNYFDRMFTANSGKYGMNTFTMPFNYDDDVVYYYDVKSGGVHTDIVTMTLQYYLGEEFKTATLDEVKAMTATQLSDIVATNKAKWLITFDAYKLTQLDIKLQFKYMYKFNDFKTVWYGQETEEYISLHTAPGIIKDKAVTGLKDYIIDTNLYKYVYDNSKPSNLSAYVANSGMFIHTLWLNDDFAVVDNTNNVIKIANYDGLQLLTNVRKLSLKNAGVTPSITEYVAGMSSLVELDLSNNGAKFSDRNTGLINLPTGSNNGLIRRLSALTKLEKLHLEGNFIYYFSDLKRIPNLKEVCVYNNVINITLINIDTLFGTKGVVNYSIFTSLTGKGVKVNNTAESSGYSGTSVSNAVVDAISALVYQKVIAVGADISQAYAGLSTSWSDYLKEKMTKPVTYWFGTADKDDLIKFAFDGTATTANSFRLEYTYYYFVNKYLTYDTYDIVIDFEFDIIRV